MIFLVKHNFIRTDTSIMQTIIHTNLILYLRQSQNVIFLVKNQGSFILLPFIIIKNIYLKMCFFFL